MTLESFFKEKGFNLDTWCQADMDELKAITEKVIVWPKERTVERIEDMSPTGKLSLHIQSDGDICVSLITGTTVDDHMWNTVEFCAGGGGGGRSHNTRAALMALMVAMEKDNSEYPIAPAQPSPVDANK